ncbi:MAG: YicC family protein [Methyloprofundus sp.]|nr:YicC family protein [Methyloprofundus sp.]
MTYSMTAFANSEVEFEGLTLHCELRSVNHRYCDISLKIPERFRFMEASTRQSISKQLKRGKIECSFSYKKQQKTTAMLDVNMDAVQVLLNSAKEIEQLMHSSKSFSALEVLSFPGIQAEKSSNNAELQKTLQQLLQTTLDSFLAARLREGEQLQRLVTERCEKMQGFVEQAKTRMPIVLDKLKNKLKNQITELVAEPNHDRIEQEMVILAQKLDVEEEIDRLETHISEVLHILQKNEPVGRRLDFLMQEMNREANTLGSKSADKEMTAIAIELKVLIEQMREQIQNIE